MTEIFTIVVYSLLFPSQFAKDLCQVENEQFERAGITLSYCPSQSKSFGVFVESDLGFGVHVHVLKNVDVDLFHPLLLKRIYDVRDLDRVKGFTLVNQAHDKGDFVLFAFFDWLTTWRWSVVEKPLRNPACSLG